MEESIHKFDKIKREGAQKASNFTPDEDIYKTEKVDGANARFFKGTDPVEIRFATRNTVFVSSKHTDYKADGYGSFQVAVDYINNHLTVDDLEDDKIYFGECMTKHSINYDWLNSPRFILFDIYDTTNKTYLRLDKLREFTSKHDMELIPVLFEGKYKDMPTDIPQSKYGNVQAEGFVIKPQECSYDVTGNIHRAKVVGEQFKEAKKEAWGSSGNPVERFCNKFCTVARIDKLLHKLVDYGALEDLEEMSILKKIGLIEYELSKDICTEEFKALRKLGVINFAEIKREVIIRIKRFISYVPPENKIELNTQTKDL